MLLREAFLVLGWLFSDPLSVGTQAPDFKGVDQDGQAVALSALRGKNVVLVFYPADNTPTCTTQLCEFREHWPDVQKKNAVVFGVNPGSAAKHQDFRKAKSFPFPLIVDDGQRIAELYHSDAWPVPKRTVYLIGPDGKIRYAKRGKPDPKEVLAAAQ
jgi:peroxiredoxin Q/BCP